MTSPTRFTEIYRTEPGRRRECLYYLALGHYKMGNFDEARRFNGEYYSRIDFFPVAEPKTALLLEKEPTNLQAQSLAVLIDKGVARGKHVASLCIMYAAFNTIVLWQRVTSEWPLQGGQLL